MKEKRADTIRALGHTSLGCDKKTKSQLRLLAGNRPLIVVLRELVGEKLEVKNS